MLHHEKAAGLQPAAGDGVQTTARDSLIVHRPAPSVNRHLLARHREFQIRSSAVDVCLARLEDHGCDPDERWLLRRLHDIFAAHGMAGGGVP